MKKKFEVFISEANSSLHNHFKWWAQELLPAALLGGRRTARIVAIFMLAGEDPSDLGSFVESTANDRILDI
jgi:hypothetical protein